MNRLIDLSQIKNGLKILQGIQEIQESYDGFKVVSSVLNEETGEEYSVNEMIETFKGTLDINFKDKGTLQEQISQAIIDLREILESQLESTNVAIDTINNRIIKDRVKIKGTITKDLETGEWVQSIDEKFEEIAGSVSLSHGPYVVYDINNKPLQGVDGGNIYYDFSGRQLSDVPHKINEENADVIEYLPIEELVWFKVFPVGEFTFETLPSDYLLDNEELNLIAYSKAVDEIIFMLSQNGELVDHIKELVGQESVQSQIKAITQVLQDEIDDINALLQNTDTGLAAIDKRDYNSNLERKYEIDLINSVKDIEDSFIVSVKAIEGTPTMDSEFSLSKTPSEKKVIAFVNGIRYVEGSLFSIDRSLNKMVWTLNEEAGGIDLEEGYAIEVVYQHEESIAQPEYRQ